MSEQLQRIRNTIATPADGAPFETYEWDDNMSVKCSDPLAEVLRNIALEVPQFFPPSDKSQFCSERGRDFLRLLLEITKTGE